MPSTTRGLFPYPAATDNWKAIRTALQALADRAALVGALWSATTAASRGAAGTAGKFHRATDTGAVGLDTGTSWVEFLLTSGSQTVAGVKNFTGGLQDNGAAVYSPSNPPPPGGAVIAQTIRGTITIATNATTVTATIPAVNMAKAQLRFLGSGGPTGPGGAAADYIELTSPTTVRVSGPGTTGRVVSYEITEWT